MIINVLFSLVIALTLGMGSVCANDDSDADKNVTTSALDTVPVSHEAVEQVSATDVDRDGHYDVEVEELNGSSAPEGDFEPTALNSHHALDLGEKSLDSEYDTDGDDDGDDSW